jgi:hypothetical protein
MNFHMPRVTKDLELCLPLRHSGAPLFPSSGITVTAVNSPTFTWEGMEGNGNNRHLNMGDLSFLNAASAFTMMFWFNQDVAGTVDVIFSKDKDATHTIWMQTLAGPKLKFQIEDGSNNSGDIDITTALPANAWHHVALAFDGSLSGNANRAKFYIDSTAQTVTFTGTIPAATADLSSTNALLGYTSVSFDGEIKDFRIFSRALSAGEIRACMHPTT